MSISVAQFIERLTDSGLMSASEIDTFQQQLPPDKRPKDAQQIAQVLVHQGKLTKYQAQAVYQGKTKGLVFGQYVVLDKLGEGGMGVVLKAQHRRMKRTVAIKVLSASAMKQAGSVERFHREVEAAAKLSHPNIVTAHDADEHQGMHYLVTEYVEGKDLAAIIQEKGPLGVQEAVECVLQAARGLQYAHSKGIVHRDIKPGNLLLDKEGTVKILDMGLARITGTEAAMGGAERLTTTGQIMGTCDYMAPEQSLDTHQADARADIYSLGCTLYRLLTGNPPYRGETFAKLFLMHLEAPIPSLCEARPDVPAALDAIYQRMLAKKSEDRQQSMAEVVAELEAMLAVLSGRSATAAVAKAESSSGALAHTLSFLQEDRPVGTLTKQQKTAAEQRTQPNLGAEHDTTSNILGKARKAVAKVRRKPLVLAGLAGGLVLLLGIVLTITLRRGTLVIEIDEELGKDVQVAVSQGAEKVQLVDAKSGWTISLGPGKYDVAVNGGDDQFLLDSKTVVVKRGDHVKVRITLKPPPLAIAPFDAQKAKEHQMAWAKYLGVPVEMTNAIGMKLVLIPPGEFMMGDDGDNDAKPAHRVIITKPFYLGKYEVTQEEWEAVMRLNPSEFKGPKNPVEHVRWEHCQVFLKKLGEKCGVAEGSYRLPIEVQWEYACRAGSTGVWCFGDTEVELDDYGWYQENSEKKTHPVGEKKANAWGLYDVHGNVFEWCADWFDKDYYKASPGSDPTGPSSGSVRVRRGGSWYDNAKWCRSADRSRWDRGYRPDDLGFRVLQVLADKPTERATPPRPTATPSKVTDSSAIAPAITGAQAATGTQPSPFVGPDGKWKLPPGAPAPAIAPFDATKAKEHQEAWAKHLGVPVEQTNSIGMKLVLIPPGEFTMGAGDQAHRVTITKPFCLGKYEVTQEEWERVMVNNPSKFKGVKNPVESVSWEDCQVFLKKLGQKCSAAEGSYRLPSEAQWEYSCRAGSTGAWCSGDSETGLDDYAWYENNSERKTHPVGEKKANAWGLHDIHGNVHEWCADWHDKDYYKTSLLIDPTGPSLGSDRVLRGGSWYNPAWFCRSPYRTLYGPDRSRDYMGLRVCLVLADKPNERATPPSAPTTPTVTGSSTAAPGRRDEHEWAEHSARCSTHPAQSDHQLRSGVAVRLVGELLPARGQLAAKLADPSGTHVEPPGHVGGSVPYRRRFGNASITSRQ